ncbi:hypothetical protein ES703_108019 [subsurface metagenome]
MGIEYTAGGVATADIAAKAVTSAKLDDTTVKYALVEISADDIKALYTTAKELVATPGAGYVLEFISIVLTYEYGTIVYDLTSCTDLEVRITNKSGSAVSTTQAVAGMLDQSSDQIRALDKLEASVTPVDAAPLCLALDGADPTAGDGLVHAMVSYRILPTGV